MFQTGSFKFRNISDGRGNLTAIEGGVDIPFDIKRVYYITKVGEGIVRGAHSHRALHQVLLCLEGSVRIRVFHGEDQEDVWLRSPTEGLYIGPWVWREMYDFSEHAVLLVLASERYDEADYIRDHDAYLAEMKQIFPD